MIKVRRYFCPKVSPIHTMSLDGTFPWSPSTRAEHLHGKKSSGKSLREEKKRKSKNLEDSSGTK